MNLSEVKLESVESSHDEIIRKIKRGGRIFIGSGSSCPQTLVATLLKNAEYFSNNEIIHLHTFGNAEYTDPKYVNSFRHNAFFIGENVRKGIAIGAADYTPIFLSEIAGLMRTGGMTIDAALIKVSPPDRFGYCSFGINVDVTKEATKQARIVIAEINPNMPVTYGNSYIHISEIDYSIETNDPLAEHHPPKIDEISSQIGENVARLIDDGSTLQMGIGIIPDAVLKNLSDREDLGIHTEMFSDGLIELYENGVITNKRKGFHDGKIITSFCIGTKKLFDFVDKNPAVEFLTSDYINNPVNIARNNKMVAINSALEVDLTGQVCADSIGSRFYSGIGGQVDFIRGAAMSNGGKPIIALPSTAKRGEISRISAQLSPGAGVVTTRGDVHYVVTEYGVAYLHGKSIRQRSMELLRIAHPDFRSDLLAYLKEKRYVSSTQREIDSEIGRITRRYATEIIINDDEKIRFRPIRPSDERIVQDFFYSHSEETIYNRYFHHRKSMNSDAAHELVSLNLKEDMAIVGLVGSRENEKIVAIGRYSLNPTENSAEIAFVVHEDFQGKHIGSHLLVQLIEIGRNRNIRKFTGHMLATNVGMMRVLEKHIPQFEKKIEGNMIKISLDVSSISEDYHFT